MLAPYCEATNSELNVLRRCDGAANFAGTLGMACGGGVQCSDVCVGQGGSLLSVDQ